VETSASPAKMDEFGSQCGRTLQALAGVTTPPNLKAWF